MKKLTSEHTVLIGILILAGTFRVGLLIWQSDRLNSDPDTYVALANELRIGNGYVIPNSERPTAFRPPLYPLLLAALSIVGSAVRVESMLLLIGGLHLILGTATVWLTYRFARMWRIPVWAAIFSALLVAVDPLLLWYTAYPMTETLFTFLVISLLYASGLPRGVSKQIAIGLLFGLCALCRPSIWPFAVMMSIAWLLWQRQQLMQEHNKIQLVTFCRSLPWITILVTVATLAPWGIRNQLLFGKPIVTTTHGGYTLLLGNNPVFYKEVVQQPWGAVWSLESLTNWQKAIESDIQTELGGNASEPERDRWLYRRACHNITSHFQSFYLSSLLRFVRFWNLAPIGATADSLPGSIYWAVFSYYLLITIGLIAGCSQTSKHQILQICIILIISFTLVHFFFWSNTRMRAPLIPAISILTVSGWFSLFRLCFDGRSNPPAQTSQD